MNGRKTGGRRAGTPNKATAEIRDLARADGPAVFKELVRLAFKSNSEQTRVAAIKEILDRAYGRASQPIDALKLRMRLRRLCGDGDIRAVSRCAQRYGKADTPAATGYEDSLACQAHLRSSCHCTTVDQGVWRSDRSGGRQDDSGLSQAELWGLKRFPG
jgi:hypothetical protein